MSLKTAGIVVVSALVILGGGWYVVSKSHTAKPSEASAPLAKPWVQVVTPPATVTVSSSAPRALQTGDEVSEGDTVTTGAKGRVNIYFPSGATARLDQNTSLVIAAASQDQRGVLVSLRLLSGRVWSKIATVANVSTSWEVKSSNAVAVVRGTAFSFEYKNGHSHVVGAEHTVQVSPLDPKSGLIIGNQEVAVHEKELVDIGDSDAPKFQNGSAHIEVKAAGTLGTDQWFKDNQNQDSILENQVSEIQAKGDSNTSLSSRLKEDVSQGSSGDTNTSPSSGTTNTTNSSQTSGTTGTTGSSGTSGGGSGGATPTAAKPTALIIRPKSSLTAISEGDRVLFTALLKMSDGTMKDVTSETSWKVSGPIGTMQGGVLLAALDPSLGDVPSADGEVLATWQTFSAKIAVTVNAKIEILDTTGQ